MATLAEELEKRLARAGVRGSPQRIEASILAAFDELLSDMRPMDPLKDLTPEEQAALRRGGLVLEPIDYGKNDPVLKSAARYSAMIASGLTVAEAAKKLGIDETRVRHRLADRTLYGLKVRGNWVLPAFQFEGNGLLPGIDVVLPRMPLGLHPIEVLNWFALPNSDLVIGREEKAVSPRAWLRMGNDPKIVADLAAGMDEGL